MDFKILDMHYWLIDNLLKSWTGKDESISYIIYVKQNRENFVPDMLQQFSCRHLLSVEGERQDRNGI